MQVLLIPTSGKLKYLNYIKTVEYSVNTNELLTVCDKKNIKLINKIKSENVHLWGVPDGHNNQNLKEWNKAQTGDTCLFYRDKKYFSQSKIISKFEDENIALRLWKKDHKGDVWKNLMVLESLSSISISSYRFNKLLKKKNTPLNSFKVQNIKEEEFLKQIGITNLKPHKNLDKEHYQKRLNELDQVDGLKSDAKVRLEQNIFTNFLFNKNSKTRCAICSKNYPNSIMVAGHIKKRSLCDESEKRNLNVIMPICKIGCDDLFERGYIYLDSGGYVRLNKDKELSEDLINYLKTIVNKHSWYFNKDNANFYEQHRKIVMNAQNDA
jgi:hypothetical protein